jgi:2-C-methyl-D-erythritol 4-phosphate cytidylyltransferase
VGVVAGGEERVDSVMEGVAALPAQTTVVVVHDGARPLVTVDVIEGALEQLTRDASLAGIVVGHPVTDTLHESDDRGLLVGTPDRERLWAAQTPQVFRIEALKKGLSEVSGAVPTDDAGTVAATGGRVAFFEGSRQNVKVTVPEDLGYVRWMLEQGTGAS